ncbi:MAG: nickel pincer cofactor biosynthesis protein LarB [Ignavibacteria bacterium]|jgi:NCAIR mutase (PurE)-related protein
MKQKNNPSAPLRMKGYIDLGFAKYDLHREKIKGFPEVILALGKDEEHLTTIVSKAIERTKMLLVTKITPQQYKAIKKALSKKKSLKITYHETARLLFIGKTKKNEIGKVAVVCAGTADVPIAEEAACSLEIFGSKVERLYDVGVAGIHRLLNNTSVFENCNVVVVVAGMDGVLPSVVGGLVSCPLIAVPTSVGYGSSFGGLAALLTMLNSCAIGISVVNIDNGFGAAYQAHLINKMASLK